MAKITHSHGKPSGLPGYWFGAGYGKDEAMSRAADRCAAWLVLHIGQDVEVRCNSDGQSGGAFRNGQGWECWYGLCARRNYPERNVVFEADFVFPLQDSPAVKAEVPCHDLNETPLLAPKDFGTVYSERFPTLGEAGRWLRRWGGKFCPEIRQAPGLTCRRKGKT